MTDVVKHSCWDHTGENSPCKWKRKLFVVYFNKHSWCICSVFRIVLFGVISFSKFGYSSSKLVTVKEKYLVFPWQCGVLAKLLEMVFEYRTVSFLLSVSESVLKCGQLSICKSSSLPYL